VQSSATLWKRCEDAVQSHRTSRGGVYFEHARNKRRALAFAQRVRQRTVGSSRASWARYGRTVCTLYRRFVNALIGLGVCNAF